MQQDLAHARSELHRLRAIADEMQYENQLNLDKFYAKVREAKDRIKRLRKEMEQLFDRYLLQIDLQENSTVHAFSIATVTCKELRNHVENQTESLGLARESPLKSKQILSESRKMCEIFEQTFKEIKDAHIKYEVKLSADENLPIMIEKLQKLCTPETFESDEIMETASLKEETEEPKSKSFFNIQTLTPVKEAKEIRVRNDDKVPLITGCCWLSDEYAILCDNNNRKLKILDGNLNIKLSALCTNSPFDIALLDESTCVMTIPDAKSIQYVTVQPGFRFKHTKCLKLRCFGVDVHGENIFVCIDDLQQSVKCVKILSLDGDCVSYVTHQGAGSPRYLCVNEDGSRICYTGGLDKDVFINCITNDGFGIFSVSSTDLQSPRSVVTDNDGNILVVDDKAECLQIVSADGVFGKKLIVENETVSEPTSCCLNRTEKLVIVSFWQTQSSKVILYKLVYL